jgi:HD-GYP domain-containing protein (c-di-GMP phosphodiesterase class II)
VDADLRLVSLDEAAGQVLAHTMRDGVRRVLLQAGVTLTPPLIDALRRRGLTAVYVQDAGGPDTGVEETIRLETRARANQAVEELFARVRAGSLDRLAEARAAVSAILHDLTATGSAVFVMSTLHERDADLFAHSVNVCALSLMIGQMSGMTGEELDQLGVGALLHDVGKIYYMDIVAKRGPLTAEEQARVRRHPVDGFEILRRHPDVHLFSAHVAYQHHERLDGSGYPRGIRGDRMLRHAKIAAVADAYDGLVSERPYRPALLPHEAVRRLQDQAGTKFDADAVRRLAHRLAVYPEGTIVRLDSGELGVVAAQGPRPAAVVVHLVTDAQQRPVEPVEVALATDPQQRRVAEVLSRWPEGVAEPAGAART